MFESITMAEPKTETSRTEDVPHTLPVEPIPSAGKEDLAETEQYDISVQPDAYGDPDRVHVTFIFPCVRK